MILSGIPEGALLEILSLVPAYDLILRCRLVCSLWRDIIDSPALWKKKCQRDGLVSKLSQRIPPDWRMFCFFHLKKKNLLKNSCASEGFQHWNIEENSGDEWKIEQLPGAHGQPFPDEKVKDYFVTSYGMCLKSQLIDLEAEGYPGHWMDAMQPDIVIRDWYAARHDCGSMYVLDVQLLSKEKTIIEGFLPDQIFIEQWSDAKWSQIEHRFKNYGPGVRYILFRHGGKDTQFWAGWYGIRVTNSSILIDPGDLST
nr:TPA: hypothetical protein GDO54_003937 [Pyxicephalus adspersus]DBA16557.1 TPA: hypothetical protein GDO54_003937 [Pyxicephalus adspersus]DBA16558.1 TPA: hypothetical protein GDO54_003937 [Pyxicephalus adspersus]